jgi:hypothetical protein
MADLQVVAVLTALAAAGDHLAQAPAIHPLSEVSGS